VSGNKQADGSMRFRLGPVEYAIVFSLIAGTGWWMKSMADKLDDVRDRVATIEGRLHEKPKGY
jgi:hypothetical protein